jgi:hypothetical protein
MGDAYQEYAWIVVAGTLLVTEDDSTATSGVLVTGSVCHRELASSACECGEVAKFPSEEALSLELDSSETFPSCTLRSPVSRLTEVEMLAAGPATERCTINVCYS